MSIPVANHRRAIFSHFQHLDIGRMQRSTPSCVWDKLHLAVLQSIVQLHVMVRSRSSGDLGRYMSYSGLDLHPFPATPLCLFQIAEAHPLLYLQVPTSRRRRSRGGGGAMSGAGCVPCWLQPCCKKLSTSDHPDCLRPSRHIDTRVLHILHRPLHRSLRPHQVHLVRFCDVRYAVLLR